MSRDLDTATEGQQTRMGPQASDQRRRGLGWRKLHVLAAAGVLGPSSPPWGSSRVPSRCCSR